jgi:CHAP domain
MRNLFFYWAIFLGVYHSAWGQVDLGLSAFSGRPSASGKFDNRKLTAESQTRLCLTKTALSQTHVRELTGHNDGVEIRKYLKILNLPEGTPYCGAFVEWVYRQCGVVSIVQAPAVAYSWAKYPNRIVWNKAPILGKKAPQQGDVAVFAWRQRRGGVRYHSELVVEWQDDDEVEDFVTVGGNTSSPTNKKIEGVFRKLRDKDIAAVSDHISMSFSKQSTLKPIWP